MIENYKEGYLDLDTSKQPFSIFSSKITIRVSYIIKKYEENGKEKYVICLQKTYHDSCKSKCVSVAKSGKRIIKCPVCRATARLSIHYDNYDLYTIYLKSKIIEKEGIDYTKVNFDYD